MGVLKFDALTSLRKASSRLSPALSSECSSDSFRDLTNEDLALLANILSHQPPPTLRKESSQVRDYVKFTKADIEKLPPHLRGRSGPLAKIANRNEGGACNYNLCSLHAKLHKNQIHSILYWVMREIDVHIPAILYAIGKANLLTVETYEPFRLLREVSSMWHDPEVYFEILHAKANPHWKIQEDSCSACILSRFGGQAEILVALKAGMIARSRSSAMNKSKRHAFVNALSRSGFLQNESDEIMRSAVTMGAEIKVLLKRVISQKNAEMGLGEHDGPLPCRETTETPTGPGDESANGVEDLRDVYDTVDDLIDEYRKEILGSQTDLHESEHGSMFPMSAQKFSMEEQQLSISHLRPGLTGSLNEHASK